MPLVVVAKSIVFFWGPVGPWVLELNAGQGQVSNSLLSPIDFKLTSRMNVLTIVIVLTIPG
jgi:hypothetical protein